MPLVRRVAMMLGLVIVSSAGSFYGCRVNQSAEDIS